MIVKLTYKNELDIPVLLYSNQGSAQPVQPGQTLEMTFPAVPDEHDVDELVLIAQPVTG